MKLSRLWKNRIVHNVVGHPLSEILYWFAGADWSEWMHCATEAPASDWDKGELSPEAAAQLNQILASPSTAKIEPRDMPSVEKEQQNEQGATK